METTSMEAVSPVLMPIVQYGFAGLCAVLIGVIVWLVNRLLGVLAATNAALQRVAEAVAANTNAVAILSERTGDELALIRDLRERLLKRPCLVKDDGAP